MTLPSRAPVEAAACALTVDQHQGCEVKPRPVGQRFDTLAAGIGSLRALAASKPTRDRRPWTTGRAQGHARREPVRDLSE